ncbi:MAG TPA: DUF5662 family protein [Candidatus Paceibacterota bacterium]|nr:DUF5662 family protein [Candidatus Paceibacterota bacterium]
MKNCYIEYSKYLLKHKFYVTLECFKIGLFWRGLKHDMSKFLPSEFIPYARFFYGQGKKERDKIRNKTGYYKPHDTGDEKFDYAWLHHVRNNDHHWQFYCMPKDADVGGIKIYEMPKNAVFEMMCDWIGASKAQKAGSVTNWYKQNGKKLILDEKARIIIETEVQYGMLKNR